MKTATKIFLILSIVFSVMIVISSFGYVYILNRTDLITLTISENLIPVVKIILVCFAIIRTVGIVISAIALSMLNTRRSHKDLIVAGVATIICSTIIGGTFMLVLTDENLKNSNSKNNNDNINYEDCVYNIYEK